MADWKVKVCEKTTIEDGDYIMYVQPSDWMLESG